MQRRRLVLCGQTGGKPDDYLFHEPGTAHRCGIGAAFGTIFCLPAAAQSDEDEAAEADSLVEEIVVTATYRDTNLMDTPVTISALTDIDLEQRGVEDITSLFLAIPGLNYGNATNTWHRVVARGIAQFRAPTSPVSIYVDNVPVTGTSTRQPRLPNFDLERIEVLKGPQGTLYGEGSMAGAIRYITKKPNPAGFDWSIAARISDPSHSSDMGLRIDSMVNIPLGERLAARITPYARNKAGILDKVGPEILEDVDGIDERGVRAQLAFYPTDTLMLNATYYYVESDIGGPGIAFHCFSEERPAGGNFPRGERTPSSTAISHHRGLRNRGERHVRRGDPEIQGRPVPRLRDAHGLAAIKRRRNFRDGDHQPQRRVGAAVGRPDGGLGVL